MKREGNTLRNLGAGAARRLPDGRNAFKHMDAGQRATFLAEIAEKYPDDEPPGRAGAVLGPARRAARRGGAHPDIPGATVTWHPEPDSLASVGDALDTIATRLDALGNCNNIIGDHVRAVVQTIRYMVGSR